MWVRLSVGEDVEEVEYRMDVCMKVMLGVVYMRMM